MLRQLAALLLSAAALCPAGSIRLKATSPEILRTRLDQLVNKNDQRADTLFRLFEQAGCADLKRVPVRGAKLPNVVCTIPGKDPKMIVVGAHHDFTGQGKGAVDNWSGASLLPSIYEALAVEQRQYTYVLVGFAAEERMWIAWG